MRKYLKIILPLFLVVVLHIFFRPIPVNIDDTAIVYQIWNVEEQGTKAHVKIKGKVEKNLKLQSRFSGVIEFGGIDHITGLRIEYDDLICDAMIKEPVFFRIDPIDGSYLHYNLVSHGEIYMESIGIIFFNDNFTQVTCMLYTPVDGSTTNRHWSMDGGWMISAPATTKEKALEISNELMSDWFKRYERQGITVKIY